MTFTLSAFFLILVCLRALTGLTVNAEYFLGYPIEEFLKLTISIPPQGSQPQPITTKYPRAYERLREYLHNMLKPMLEQIIVTGNPGVSQGYPYPYPHLRVQVSTGWG